MNNLVPWFPPSLLPAELVMFQRQSGRDEKKRERLRGKTRGGETEREEGGKGEEREISGEEKGSRGRRLRDGR